MLNQAQLNTYSANFTLINGIDFVEIHISLPVYDFLDKMEKFEMMVYCKRITDNNCLELLNEARVYEIGYIKLLQPMEDDTHRLRKYMPVTAC